MYEPPSSLTALLPLTFEWSVAALVLALIGIVAGGWLWLLAVPLLTTWAMCINGALKAPIDPRFTGLKARALVALLIYLGPLLRGWERLKWRVKTMQAEATGGLEPPIQKARISLPRPSIRSIRPFDRCCSIAYSSAMRTGSFVVIRVVDVVTISFFVVAAM